MTAAAAAAVAAAVTKAVAGPATVAAPAAVAAAIVGAAAAAMAAAAVELLATATEHCVHWQQDITDLDASSCTPCLIWANILETLCGSCTK